MAEPEVTAAQKRAGSCRVLPAYANADSDSEGAEDKRAPQVNEVREPLAAAAAKSRKGPVRFTADSVKIVEDFFSALFVSPEGSWAPTVPGMLDQVCGMLRATRLQLLAGVAQSPLHYLALPTAPNMRLTFSPVAWHVIHHVVRRLIGPTAFLLPSTMRGMRVTLLVFADRFAETVRAKPRARIEVGSRSVRPRRSGGEWERKETVRLLGVDHWCKGLRSW